MSNRSDTWFSGPGRYFWTSDARLADLELGFCATKQELGRAVRNMVHLGREELEWGGSAYRVHGATTANPGKTMHPLPKTQRRSTTWRDALKLSA